MSSATRFSKRQLDLGIAYPKKYQAKTHLSKLLDRVAKGEQIIITRHGSPVAILQPADKEKQIDVAAVIQKMRKFRKSHRLNGLAIKDMIEQGRK